MKGIPQINWPPIINDDKIPLWIRLRDIVLTTIAWLIIAITLHNFLWLVFDFFSDPIFGLTSTDPVNWSIIWEKLSRFVYIALGLVVWICFLGLLRKKIINSTRYIKTAPPAEQIKKLEIALGVLPADVENWHEIRSAQVFINGDNRIYKIIPSAKN